METVEPGDCYIEIDELEKLVHLEAGVCSVDIGGELEQLEAGDHQEAVRSGNDDECVTELELDPEWVESMSLMVGDLSSNKRGLINADPSTICRVPAIYRNANPDAYTPRVISLGPYHRNEAQPRPMDHLKVRYLRRALQRNPGAKLEDYLKLMKKLEGRARSAYSESFDGIESNDFAAMLLLDGCFILHVFFGSEFAGGDYFRGEFVDDPVVSTEWGLDSVVFDMFLLENQIPFFVLESLYCLIMDAAAATTRLKLVQEIADILIRLLPSGSKFQAPWDVVSVSVPEVYHILHLFHSIIKPIQARDQGSRSQSRIGRSMELLSGNLGTLSNRLSFCYNSEVTSTESNNNEYSVPFDLIPCATRLEEAGVKFKKKKSSSCLDITFQNGIMGIPTLLVVDSTGYVFHNLIVFEQCFQRFGTHVTAYALVMDYLIDKEEDVALLKENGCMVNALGSDAEAATLFNKLCRDVALTPEECDLTEFIQDVKKHCDSKWNRWRAILMHDYFTNPWVIFSLIGVILVIVLTVIQTVYSLLAYYHYNDN